MKTKNLGIRLFCTMYMFKKKKNILVDLETLIMRKISTGKEAFGTH